MKNKHSALYHYLIKRSDKITNQWLSKTSGISSPDKAKPYIRAVAHLLTAHQPEKEWEEALDCAREMARDRAPSQVPIYESINGINVFRRIIIDEIGMFSHEEAPESSKCDVLEWSRRLNLIMDEIIGQFMTEYDLLTMSQLKTQNEMIHELSAPVIPISSHIGVLPIIGEIDTHRAKGILESALERCAGLRLSHLFIDISGVPIIDTMVVYQLFRILDTTKLLGIEATISGIRPEMAQTVVKLGIDFSNVKTEQNLAKALSKKGFRILEEGDGTYKNTV